MQEEDDGMDNKFISSLDRYEQWSPHPFKSLSAIASDTIRSHDKV